MLYKSGNCKNMLYSKVLENKKSTGFSGFFARICFILLQNYGLSRIVAFTTINLPHWQNYASTNSFF
jgi:hypothetical protein